ncbi:unnamed protein product [Orchesella dallaii]|uniref:Uncharacterized protein n=1 Tax=Orchesella dallaii TaxID=48710 RepID=A0ABP1QV83_9HEXA
MFQDKAAMQADRALADVANGMRNVLGNQQVLLDELTDIRITQQRQEGKMRNLKLRLKDMQRHNSLGRAVTVPIDVDALDSDGEVNVQSQPSQLGIPIQQTSGTSSNPPRPSAPPLENDEESDDDREEQTNAYMPRAPAGAQAPLFMFDPLSGVAFPQYHPSKTSPEGFLTEVEEFFILKGIQPNQWHFLVAKLFPQDSDILSWWRAN